MEDRVIQVYEKLCKSLGCKEDLNANQCLSLMESAIRIVALQLGEQGKKS